MHANIGQLETLNRLYRRLAREGRSDSAGTLKRQVEDVSRRWDNLVQRTSAVVRRLKHTVNIKDDFEAVRQALILWLTDIDHQLTNLQTGTAPEQEKARKIKVVLVIL